MSKPRIPQGEFVVRLANIRKAMEARDIDNSGYIKQEARERSAKAWSPWRFAADIRP